MATSKRVIRETIVTIFVMIALVISCFYFAKILLEINHPVVTVTIAPTYTLIPTSTFINTDFEAVVKDGGNCLSGTSTLYTIIATIPQYERVLVIRKNSNNDWFLIRWKKTSIDCWIESYRLFYDFDINSVEIISTPLPITSTATSTSQSFVLTSTPKWGGAEPDTSLTSVLSTNAFLSVSTSTSAPPGSTSTSVPPGSTNTSAPPVSTNTSAPPVSTNTSAPPVNTSTSAPPVSTSTSAPPVSTNTPSGNRACNDDIDNDGDGLTDLADPGCKNKGDDDESG